LPTSIHHPADRNGAMQVADSAATSLLQQERSKIKVRKADDADDESKGDVD